MSPTKPSSARPGKSLSPAKQDATAANRTSAVKSASPAPKKHTKTFGNYVVHCSTGEPDGLPLRLFCQECETPQEARTSAQRVLDAQRPVRDPAVAWKIIKVEYLGVGLGKGGF
jgi:hypothetical protein